MNGRRILRALLGLLVAVAIVTVWASLEWLISLVWPGLLLIAALWAFVIVLAVRAAARMASSR